MRCQADMEQIGGIHPAEKGVPIDRQRGAEIVPQAMQQRDQHGSLATPTGSVLQLEGRIGTGRGPEAGRMQLGEGRLGVPRALRKLFVRLATGRWVSASRWAMQVEKTSGSWRPSRSFMRCVPSSPGSWMAIGWMARLTGPDAVVRPEGLVLARSGR